MTDHKLPAVPLVKLNGDEFGGAITRLRIERAWNAAAHLQFRLDSRLADVDKLQIGAAVEVAVRRGNSDVVTFKGTISGVGVEMSYQRSEVVVDAYDKATALMREASITTYQNIDPPTLINQIATQAGLRSETDLKGTKIQHLHLGSTLGSTLNEICRLFGADWLIDDGKLVVRSRTATPPSSSVTLAGAENLREFSARFTGSERVEKVTVRGWDLKQKQKVVTTVTASQAETTLRNAPPIETSIRREPGEFEAVAWAPLSRDAIAAKDRATGMRTSAALGQVSGHGTCDVDPRLKPGVTVEIADVGAKFNGAYRVTAVEHDFAPNSPFVTHFTVGGHTPGTLVDLLGPPTESGYARLMRGLLIGIVTSNNDPDNLSRVRVIVPLLGDQVEMGWARVVAPGAGKARGLMVMPEVGDEVLLGFEHGDVNAPVVLGGLWNGADQPPRSQADMLDGNKVVRREWATTSGNRIAIAEDGKLTGQMRLELTGEGPSAVTLENRTGVKVESQGKTIEIVNSKGNASITLDDQGNITIKGKNISFENTQGEFKIKSQRITAESQIGLTVDAGNTFDAKAKLAMTLDGGTQTEVKGAQVKIN